MGDWCTIESDPGVFTELIRKIGAKGAEVAEIYSLDMLSQFDQIHGLIFLFKWEPKPAKQVDPFPHPDLFFAQQVIQNACATQSILSIILNSNLELNKELSEFKEFSVSLQPADRGLVLSNSDLIRNTHNSFAQQEPFEFIQSKKDKKGEAYHFVSFVWFRGRLYELDGLQKGPISHGDCEEAEWVERVKPVITERMEEFAGTEIRFNLLAIVNNKREALKKKFKFTSMKVVAIKTKLMSMGADIEGDEMEYDFDESYFSSLSDEIEVLQNQLFLETDEQKQLKFDLDSEDFKYKKWREENERRKHNYIPFILNLLENLADEQKLIPFLEAAKEKQSKSKGK